MFLELSLISCPSCRRFGWSCTVLDLAAYGMVLVPGLAFMLSCTDANLGVSYLKLRELTCLKIFDPLACQLHWVSAKMSFPMH